MRHTNLQNKTELCELLFTLEFAVFWLATSACGLLRKFAILWSFRKCCISPNWESTGAKLASDSFIVLYAERKSEHLAFKLHKISP